MTNKPEPNTRPLPQPSEWAESLLNERNRMIDRITQLHAQIAKLQADGDKLALVLQEAKSVIEHGRLNEQMCCSGHMCGCQGSTNADYLLHCLTQALTEWKDRA